MKKNKIIGILAVVVLGIGVLCFGVWFLLSTGSSYYYIQIDNTKIEQGEPRQGVVDLKGGMAYSYTLPAYDEHGEEKDITFGASRELREGAFLRLTVMPVRGVVEWSEVQYEELPEEVQGKFKQ